MLVLIGAEFNAEIEHQTARDTTTGEPEPLGGRGAAMADTVGKAFTVSAREALDLARGFVGRQAGYVTRVLRLNADSRRLGRAVFPGQRKGGGAGWLRRHDRAGDD